MKESLYVAVSVETSKFDIFFFVGLLGVHTTLESPIKTAFPSFSNVKVQLNFVLPDLTDAFTVSAEAVDSTRQRKTNDNMLLDTELFDGNSFALAYQGLNIEKVHILKLFVTN